MGGQSQDWWPRAREQPQEGRWNPLRTPLAQPPHRAWNSLVQSEWVMCSMESQRQCV